MTFTQEEEDLIRLGIGLYKKRTELSLAKSAKSAYNSAIIESLQSELKAKEDVIKTEITSISLVK